MNPSILKNPDWKDYREAFPQAVEMPSRWCGKAVHWESGYHPVPVFISQFSLPSGDEIYLFGARFEMAKASVEGADSSRGHLIEYLVLEYVDGAPVIHRLRQDCGVVFASVREKNDWLPAQNLTGQKMERLCLAGKPRWKPGDAQWPASGGEPMVFIGQATLPENEVTRKLLTWNTALFLFWKATGDGSLFKMTMQGIKFQAAEEHYTLARRTRI